MDQEQHGAALADGADDAFVAWHEDGPAPLDGTRRFEPPVEHERRARALGRFGLALVVGFCAPILGAPDAPVAFPQFLLLSHGLAGWNVVTATVLLPLVVGAVLWLGARLLEPPWRGALTLAGGLSLFGLVLGWGGVDAFVAGAMHVAPGRLGLSFALLFAGAGGLLAASRVRCYRPLSRSARVVGCLAAASYAAFFLIPVHGMAPIADVVRAFPVSVPFGLAMATHTALVLAALVVTLRNPLTTPPWNASRRAGLASGLLAAAWLAPLPFVAFYALSATGGTPGAGGAVLLMLSSGAKVLLTYGLLLLLLPVGVADLWIGRSRPRS